MRLPRFVLGMLGVILTFGLVTYYLTGAFWTTVLQTVLCAVLIQAGYFLVVLFLVARTTAPRSARVSAKGTDIVKEKPEGEPAPHR